MSKYQWLLHQIPEIDPTANYWFFRTDGGSLYGTFIKTGSIALGYPEIRDTMVQPINPNDKNAVEKFKQHLTRFITHKQGASFAAHQLITFYHRMKPGDFVVIPSSGTSNLTIGTIRSQPYNEPLQIREEDSMEFFKRRRVQWLKSVKRHEVNPNLFRILNTHQTIVNANAFAQWIDPILYDLFKKGENYHYSLTIKKREDINARALFESCVDLFKIVDEFCTREGLNEDASDISTRINLNSPGKVELMTKAARYISFVSLVVILLNGGNLELKTKEIGVDLKIESKGLIEKLNHFLNDRSRRELRGTLEKKLAELKVENSQQIEGLLAAIEEHDEK